MTGYFAEAGVFLISICFGFAILLVMLRFLLQCTRADFHNPVSQFLVKATTPALRPLRRVIPGFAGFDMAAVVLMLLLKLMEQWMIALLVGSTIHAGLLLLFSITRLVSLVLTIYLVCIFIQVIISWIQPGTYNPIIRLLDQLTSPVLRPLRRAIPPISGLDLSPLVAIVLIQLLAMAIPHLEKTLAGLFFG